MSHTIIESQYPYSYVDDDGIEIAFREGDRFILIDKSSEDWWKVQRTGLFTGKSVCYIPAAYMKVLNITQKENKTISPYANLKNNIEILSKEKTLNEDLVLQKQDYVNLEDYRKNIFSKKNGPSFTSEILGSLPYLSDQLEKSIEDEDAAFDESQDELQNISDAKLNSSSDASLPRSLSAGSLSFEISPRPEPLKTFTLPKGWKKCSDDNGRSFYYNEEKKEKTWKPPRINQLSNNQEQENIPDGWTLQSDPDTGELIYINQRTKERWKSNTDKDNRVYYYCIDGSGTSWELPNLDETGKPINIRRKSLDNTLEGILRRQTMSNNARTNKCQSVYVRSHSSLSSNDDQPKSPRGSPSLQKSHVKLSEFSQHNDNKLNRSFDLDDISEVDSTKNVKKADKEGPLFRRKLVEGKKAIKKSMWQPIYCCKYGSSLVFYKDQKSLSKVGFATGKPDSSLDLHGAILSHVTKDKAKGKKNVFQITSYGNQTVQQFVADNEIDMAQWITCIQTTIKHLEEKEPLPPTLVEEVDSGSSYKVKSKYGSLNPTNSAIISPEDDCARPTTTSMPRHLTNEKSGLKGFHRRLSKRGTNSSSNTEIDDKEKTKIKKKLRKYIAARPTFDDLETQGIIKDYYFGCPIGKICEREDTLVPKLVVQLINEVEKRGLDVDGIYRVSGNLSMVQKLRVMVDHGEAIDYQQHQWNDIHLLTGALKLYFRELPEPLIPFNMFEKFITATKSPFKVEKIKMLKNLIQELPKENAETLHLLITHLTKVMEHSSKNRMQSQNLSIIFGPTLLWPEHESLDMATTTVYQSLTIELLLLDCENIFSVL